MSPAPANELVRFQWTCGVGACRIVADGRFCGGDSDVEDEGTLAIHLGQQGLTEFHPLKTPPFVGDHRGDMVSALLALRQSFTRGW